MRNSDQTYNVECWSTPGEVKSPEIKSGFKTNVSSTLLKPETYLRTPTIL